VVGRVVLRGLKVPWKQLLPADTDFNRRPFGKDVFLKRDHLEEEQTDVGEKSCWF